MKYVGIIMIFISALAGCNDKSIKSKTLMASITKANKTGNPTDEAYIGYLYYKGELEAKQNYGEAKEWYEKAANHGDANAMCSLGWLYQNGFGVKQNYQQARKFYEKAVDKGNAQAALNLGLMYINGYGIEQNSKTAIKLFKFASEKGNSYAMQNLGRIYNQGIGVKKNQSEAKKWYERGANAGRPFSIFKLGLFYYSGVGGEAVNYKKAWEFFRKSAGLGSSDSMNMMGSLYLLGRGGVKVDYKKARTWFLKAAALNNPLSMSWLGEIYSKGYGVPINIKKAEEWQKKGVALNCGPAMMRLSLLWADNNQPDKAEKLILQAMKKFPIYGFNDTYGYILFKQGKYEVAIKVLNKVIKKSPKSKTARIYLGDIYFKLGKIQKAEKYWQEALLLLSLAGDDKRLIQKIKDKLTTVKSGVGAQN